MVPRPRRPVSPEEEENRRKRKAELKRLERERKRRREDEANEACKQDRRERRASQRSNYQRGWIVFQNFLVLSLEAWMGQQPMEIPPTTTNQAKELNNSQNDIGWTNFTR